jgi:CheY-like chemotaxis protein
MSSPSSARGAVSHAEFILRRCLASALGSAARVDELLLASLALTGRSRLPTSPTELLAFVKAHVLRVVTTEIGARPAMTFLEALVADLVADGDRDFFPEPVTHPRSTTPAPALTLPPASGMRTRRSILLVDSDRFGRAALARSLVRGACDVRVCDDASAAATALDSSETFHVAVVDMDHPALDHVLSELVSKRPALAVIGRAHSMGEATARLAELGVVTFDVRLKAESAEDLLERIHRVTPRSDK